MSKSVTVLWLAVVLFVAGCASQAEFLNIINPLRRRRPWPAHSSR